MTETRIPRRTQRHRRTPVLLLLCAAVLVAGLLAAVVMSLRPVKAPDPEPDPHEGQVYINDGAGMVWHTPLEGVTVSPVEQDEFVRDGERIRYTGANLATRWGVDVSNYQGSIDWQALKAQGIEFAYLRLGMRGYGPEGTLYSDRSFARYYDGAKAAGIDVGVYFFSQAVTVREAAEEALHALTLLDGRALDLPVYYDWEPVAAEDSRTAAYDHLYLTAGAAAFCNVIERGGYTPGVYLNRQQGYYRYDLRSLSDRSLWVADYADYPDFYYAYDVWQYADRARLDGVSEIIDLNLEFRPIA